jgi:hypothetical protein
MIRFPSFSSHQSSFTSPDINIIGFLITFALSIICFQSIKSPYLLSFFFESLNPGGIFLEYRFSPSFFIFSKSSSL